MKILMVVNTDGALYIFRGPIIKALIDADYDVETISGKTKPEYFEALREMGVGVHGLNFERHSLSVFKGLKQISDLRNMIAKIKPDIVHNFTHKPAIFSTVAAKLVGVPRIFITITGLGNLFVNTDFKSILLRKLLLFQYRFVIKFVDIVFFQNPDDLQMFVVNGIVPTDKAILTNGSGIDLHNFWVPNVSETAKARALLGDEIGEKINERMVVLLPARCAPDKGYGEFYNAAKRILDKTENYIFIHIGWVEDYVPGKLNEQELRRLASNHGVHFLGFKEDIRPYLFASDIVALPSYREGVPRALIEALAVGRTIVTTDVPGCRETVIDGWNGYLCPERNSIELANAIEKVSPTFCAQNLLKSRELCEEKFDVRKLISITLRSYGLK